MARPETWWSSRPFPETCRRTGSCTDLRLQTGLRHWPFPHDAEAERHAAMINLAPLAAPPDQQPQKSSVPPHRKFASNLADPGVGFRHFGSPGFECLVAGPAPRKREGMPVSACPEHLSLLIDRRLGSLWDTLVIQRSTRLLRVAKCRRGGGQRNRLRPLWLTQCAKQPRDSLGRDLAFRFVDDSPLEEAGFEPSVPP
jgi:hypothetical protein